MKELGFEEFLDSSHEGYIITSFKFPENQNWNFTTFYSKLNDRGNNFVNFCVESWSHFLYDHKNFAVVLCYGAVGVVIVGVSVCRQVDFRRITFVPLDRIF